jgi:hypothetical protein
MRFPFIVLLVTVVFACNKKDRVPEGLLQKEKMEAVLWDMIQADEFLKDFRLNKDTTLNDTLESIQMYERVFRMHKTTREVFDTSFRFYRRHPALMKEILDSLHANSQQAGLPPIYVAPDSMLKRIDTSRALPRLRKPIRPD